MTEIQRINITLPKKLVKRTKRLIEEGLYANFSELVRESLKNELIADMPLLEKKEILDNWFSEEKGEKPATLSTEEIIQQVKKNKGRALGRKVQVLLPRRVKSANYPR